MLILFWYHITSIKVVGIQWHGVLDGTGISISLAAFSFSILTVRWPLIADAIYYELGAASVVVFREKIWSEIAMCLTRECYSLRPSITEMMIGIKRLCTQDCSLELFINAIEGTIVSSVLLIDPMALNHILDTLRNECYLLFHMSDSQGTLEHNM